MTTPSVAQILHEIKKSKLVFDNEDEAPSSPEFFESAETQEEAELKWPEPSASVDDALLDAFKTYVLRLMLTALVKPSQVLNAMRRLEALREFPLKKEKQERMLAIAEARIELRRRALDLREAQLAERREAREAAAVRAAEKAKAVATAKAEKAAKLAEKAAQSKTKALIHPQIDPAPLPEPTLQSREFQANESAPSATSQLKPVPITCVEGIAHIAARAFFMTQDA